MNKKAFLILIACTILVIPMMRSTYALEIPFDKNTLPFVTKKQTAPANTKSRVVKLYRVGKTSYQDSTSFPGKVEAAQKAKLFFRVSGPVIERDLVLGKHVSKGDVLMRIDPRDYQREVDALAQQIHALEAQNALASVQFARKKNLLATKSISLTEFDAAEAEKKASDAQLMALRVNHKKAKDRLNDTVLRAPFSGNITALGVELHEMVQAGFTVVVLEDLHTLKIRIHIPSGRLPEALLTPINWEKLPFHVRIPGRDETFSAQLIEFSPSASPDGESFEAVLTMKQPNGAVFLPGMSAEATISLSESLGPEARQPRSELKLSVPWSAVVNENGKSFVWLYDAAAKKLHKRHVHAERSTGSDDALITGELMPGDYVVAAGGDWLDEEMDVTVLNPEVLNEDR